MSKTPCGSDSWSASVAWTTQSSRDLLFRRRRNPVPQEYFVANGVSLSEQRPDLVQLSEIDAWLTSLQSGTVRGTPQPSAGGGYRVLGSLSEADDAVQESWLRLSRTDAGGVENLGGWLTTVVARICLDVLRARRSRSEEPVGVRVPDPIVSRADGIDPEQQALLADPVGLESVLSRPR